MIPVSTNVMTCEVLQHTLILLYRSMVLKRVLKNKVLEKSVELQIFTDPVDFVQPGNGVPLEGDSVVRLGSPSAFDEEGGQQVAQVSSRFGKAICEAPPAMFPRFELFSPDGPGVSGDAKLKLHLAHLQLEAQEKESIHEAGYDLRDTG